MLPRYDIDVFKTVPFSSIVTVKDADGSPLDLTGYNISGSAFLGPSEDIKLCDFNTELTVPESGVISFSLSYEIVTQLPPTQGIYLLMALDSGNLNGIRVLNGYLNIYPE